MYKLAFLGGGINSIAGYPHLIASQMDRKFKVIGGIFSRDKMKSKETAKKYGVIHFDSIESMCNNVDLVAVLTPTPVHYQNLKELINYNVGIIVEKPIVANVSEFDLNLDEKFVVVTHNYSGYPLVRELRSLVKNDVLGEVHKIKIDMPQESFLKPLKPGYPQEWRLVDYEIPTIALDLGVHTYHLAKFVYGNTFEPFFCQMNNFSKFNVIDDVVVFAEGEGAIVELSFSKTSLGNTNPLTIEVYGSKAGAKWSQNDFENLYLTFSDGKKEILNRGYSYFEANKPRYQRMAPGHPSGFIEAFANLYCDIHDAFEEFLDKGKFVNDFVSGYMESVESLLFFKKSLNRRFHKK